MNRARTQIMAAVGLLSATSFLLMLIEVHTPFADFLKYDPADIAALVGGFALGPLPGATIVALRNLLRALLVKPEPIGLAMNTVAGATFVLVSAAYYQSRLSRHAAAVGLVLGGLAQTLVCIPAAWLALPLYGVPTSSISGIVWGAVVPFNLFKCAVTSMLTFHFYKRVAPFLPRFRGGVFQRPRADAAKEPVPAEQHAGTESR